MNDENFKEKRLTIPSSTIREKKGYLKQDFRIFRLKDRAFHEVPAHYHDFHKLTIFLEGEGEYLIEGRLYPLAPRDIIFVSAGEVHRPIIASDRPYERIVIYISPSFLKRWHREEDLSSCFKTARNSSSVMHLNSGNTHDLLYHILKLEGVVHEEGFAQELYMEILFLEFLILLNRSIKAHELDEIEASSCDPKIQELLSYIAEHLTEELDIDQLAAQIYLSRFHLMRKFKQETGYSLHQYILSKRLLLARSRLTQGEPITTVCYDCGFGDYSSFSRAFKKMFHSTPREWQGSGK